MKRRGLAITAGSLLLIGGGAAVAWAATFGSTVTNTTDISSAEQSACQNGPVTIKFNDPIYSAEHKSYATLGFTVSGIDAPCLGHPLRFTLFNADGKAVNFNKQKETVTTITASTMTFTGWVNPSVTGVVTAITN